MVYKEPICKYELLRLFNNYLRNNEIVIEPFDGFVTDKSLVRTRFDFDYIIPDYEKMVSDLYEWIKKHSQLYSHYKLS